MKPAWSSRFWSFRPWCRRLAPALAALGLAGCGGGGGAPGDTPSALTATQAVAMMTGAPRSYPAALAVPVFLVMAIVMDKAFGKTFVVNDMAASRPRDSAPATHRPPNPTAG